MNYVIRMNHGYLFYPQKRQLCFVQYEMQVAHLASIIDP